MRNDSTEAAGSGIESNPRKSRGEAAATSSVPDPRSSILAVGGLTPLTTIDYPGELAAVIFCQGCPWRCRYCQNVHLVDRGAEAAMVWDEVERFLESRQGLLDAVVFSGGEPTLQHGLGAAMARVRELGFKVGLHTAGCYPERLGEVLPLVDWVGLDIKAMAESYEALTGVVGSGERAWRSLERLVASGVDHEVRVTVHSGLLSDQDLVRLVRRIRRCGTDKVVLQKAQTRAMLDRSLGPNAVDWLNDDRMALEGQDFAGLS